MVLPEDSELLESLMRKPLKDIRQLIRRIEEYKRLEDDRLQNKGKVPFSKSPSAGQFSVKAPKGFEDTRVKGTIGGGERDV